MRKIQIVSDSSADLLHMEHVRYSCVPMKIITDGKEFVDDPSLNVEEMNAFFEEYKGRSKTSCPNAGEWLEAFGDADDVICVTITSALSGSYNSACAAKQIYEAEHEGRRVFVVDTRSAGPEVTLVVKKLEEYVAAGMAYEEICSAIVEYLKTTGLVFMLRSLKNFAANGRVSSVVAKIVGIAGIGIVGKASDEGTLAPTHKCPGERRSLETLLADLEAYGLRTGKVSIGHTGNEQAALRLQSMITQRFDGVSVEIHPLRGLCCYYAEKGGLLVGFEKM